MGRGLDNFRHIVRRIMAINRMARGFNFMVIGQGIDLNEHPSEKDNSTIGVLNRAAFMDSPTTNKFIQKIKEKSAKYPLGVNTADSLGRTPLHWAACGGAVAALKRLISSGGDVHAEDRLRWTPLHLAALHGQLDVCKILTETGASPEARDRDGWTPVHWAASQDHASLVDHLSQAGGFHKKRRYPVDETMRTPLHVAAGNGKRAVIELYGKHQYNLNPKDMEGRTPIHYTVGSDHLEAMETLLTIGCDPNIRDGGGGTPLHYAAFLSKPKAMEILIKGGADPNVGDTQGGGPLHWVIEKGTPDTAKQLIQNGADPNLRDHKGKTCLHWAVEQDEPRIDLIRALLANGVAPDVEDEEHRTALHYLAASGHATVTKVILDAGANPAPRDDEGTEPIHFGSLCGHADYVAVIHRAGASLESKDKAGRTPLIWAAGGGHPDLVRWLLRSGAQKNSQDEDRWTALDWALDGRPEDGEDDEIQPGFDECIRILTDAKALRGWEVDRDKAAALQAAAPPSPTDNRRLSKATDSPELKAALLLQRWYRRHLFLTGRGEKVLRRTLGETQAAKFARARKLRQGHPESPLTKRRASMAAVQDFTQRRRSSVAGNMLMAKRASTGAGPGMIKEEETSHEALMATATARHASREANKQAEQERDAANAEIAKIKAEAEAARLQAEADLARVRAEAEAAKNAAANEAAKLKAQTEAARAQAELEKSRAQAEAEAERARAEADLIKAKAEAETMRLRAQQEADSLRTQAQQEADLRAAQEQSQAQAARDAAEAEATRARADAEAARAAAEAEALKARAAADAARAEAEALRAAAEAEALKARAEADAARAAAQEEAAKARSEADAARAAAEADAARAKIEAETARALFEAETARARAEADHARAAESRSARASSARSRSYNGSMSFDMASSSHQVDRAGAPNHLSTGRVPSSGRAGRSPMQSLEDQTTATAVVLSKHPPTFTLGQSGSSCIPWPSLTEHIAANGGPVVSERDIKTIFGPYCSGKTEGVTKPDLDAMLANTPRSGRTTEENKDLIRGALSTKGSSPETIMRWLNSGSGSPTAQWSEVSDALAECGIQDMSLSEVRAAFQPWDSSVEPTDGPLGLAALASLMSMPLSSPRPSQDANYGYGVSHDASRSIARSSKSNGGDADKFTVLRNVLEGRSSSADDTFKWLDQDRSGIASWDNIASAMRKSTGRPWGTDELKTAFLPYKAATSSRQWSAGVTFGVLSAYLDGTPMMAPETPSASRDGPVVSSNTGDRIRQVLETRYRDPHDTFRWLDVDHAGIASWQNVAAVLGHSTGQILSRQEVKDCFYPYRGSSSSRVWAEGLSFAVLTAYLDDTPVSMLDSSLPRPRPRPRSGPSDLRTRHSTFSMDTQDRDYSTPRNHRSQATRSHGAGHEPSRRRGDNRGRPRAWSEPFPELVDGDQGGSSPSFSVASSRVDSRNADRSLDYSRVSLRSALSGSSRDVWAELDPEARGVLSWRRATERLAHVYAIEFSGGIDEVQAVFDPWSGGARGLTHSCLKGFMNHVKPVRLPRLARRGNNSGDPRLAMLQETIRHQLEREQGTHNSVFNAPGPTVSWREVVASLRRVGVILTESEAKALFEPLVESGAQGLSTPVLHLFLHPEAQHSSSVRRQPSDGNLTRRGPPPLAHGYRHVRPSLQAYLEPPAGNFATRSTSRPSKGSGKGGRVLPALPPQSNSGHGHSGRSGCVACSKRSPSADPPEPRSSNQPRCECYRYAYRPPGKQNEQSAAYQHIQGVGWTSHVQVRRRR